MKKQFLILITVITMLFVVGCAGTTPYKSVQDTKCKYSYFAAHHLDNDTWEIKIFKNIGEKRQVITKYTTKNKDKKHYFNACANKNIPIYKDPYKNDDMIGTVNGNNLSNDCKSSVYIDGNQLKYDIKEIPFFQVGGNNPAGYYPHLYKCKN